MQLPLPDFVVRGQDGRDYPADLASLQQWVREGRITPQHQVYSNPLRELFTAPATEKQGAATCLTAGCAVTLALLVFLTIGILITGGRSRARDSSLPNASMPLAPSSSNLGNGVRTTAADLFNLRFAGSTLSGWGIRGRPAGADCSVLLVTFDVNMEDAMITSFHYGNGIYGSILPGGVARFYPERTFRGVVYRDASGRRWTYGAVSESEASSLSPC